MRYTKALIVDRFLLRPVEVAFINGRREIGRIILNNDPEAYRSVVTKFIFLPLSTDGVLFEAFNPSHVRKIEFYHSSDYVKLED